MLYQVRLDVSRKLKELAARAVFDIHTATWLTRDPQNTTCLQMHVQYEWCNGCVAALQSKLSAYPCVVAPENETVFTLSVCIEGTAHRTVYELSVMPDAIHARASSRDCTLKVSLLLLLQGHPHLHSFMLLQDGQHVPLLK